MKLNCGPTPWEKHKAKEQWHSFFCLWPRRMEKDPHDCRWLETVERRGSCYLGYWDWEFRPKEKQ